MTTGFIKITILLGTFCSLVFASCTKCPITLPYLDVKEIDVVPTETSLTLGEPLEFNIQYKSIQYLTAEKGVRQIPYKTNALYATTCEADGQLGLKYLITSVDIFANVDWNEEKTAGTSLKEYIEVGVFDSNSASYIFTAFNDFISTYSSGFDPEDMLFRLLHSPSVLGDVELTLILSKSNTTALSKVLPTVSWN